MKAHHVELCRLVIEKRLFFGMSFKAIARELRFRGPPPARLATPAAGLMSAATPSTAAGGTFEHSLTSMDISGAVIPVAIWRPTTAPAKLPPAADQARAVSLLG